ncbi:MAG TPA: hypothetical protein VEC06_13250 [Paucimonas sp.]|nr:hypothetical protein [Paucimonas sp.]
MKNFINQSLIRDLCAYLKVDETIPLSQGCLVLDGVNMQLIEDERNGSGQEDSMLVRIQLAPPLSPADKEQLIKMLTSNYDYGTRDCFVFSLMPEKSIPVVTYALPASAQLDGESLGDMLDYMATLSKQFWDAYSV